jgi:hypothetical protein
MTRKTRRLLVAALLVCSSFTSQTSHAETLIGEVSTFVPCTTNPEVDCIASISFTLPDGKTYEGTPTGITQYQDFFAGPFWHARGAIPVYKFDGMKFAYGTNTVTVRGFYWPDNSEYCAYNACTTHNESVITYVNPFAVGTNNPQFQTEGIFHLTLHLASTFIPTSSMGRAKNVKISYLGQIPTPKGAPRSIVLADFTPIHLEQTDFSSPDPTAAVQATAFEDSPALWIYGKYTDATTKLGPCVQTGGIDVYSNAISMDVPRWNAQTSTIDIWTKSPHLTTTGDLNIGYIEARIPIEMAKCMWGVNLQGEIQGKIAITYDDGSPNTIVTMTGNVNRDDYLLVIAGFHFSAPTFHVKLDQSMAKAAEVKQAETTDLPQATTTKAKTTSMKKITCVKGKVKKTVAATKCPVGFHKA